MDKLLSSSAVGAVGSPERAVTARRSLRVARSHPLVASLAGGLQATYAAQPEEAVTEHFASLLARLDRSSAGGR
ncbi:hypothetical protein CFIICLFH_1484 [Methylobacterium goesingense]|nr:hypothetical protein CFIICLFH_1484 [Methylobacterium goesingense]